MLDDKTLSIVIAFVSFLIGSLGLGYLFKGMWIEPWLYFLNRRQKLIEMLYTSRQYYYNPPFEGVSKEKEERIKIYKNLRKEGAYFASIANRLSLKIWYLIFYRKRRFEKRMYKLKGNLIFLSNILFDTPEQFSQQISQIQKLENDFEEILKFKFEFEPKRREEEVSNA